MEHRTSPRWYWAWRRWRLATWAFLLWTAFVWPWIVRLRDDWFYGDGLSSSLGAVWAVSLPFFLLAWVLSAAYGGEGGARRLGRVGRVMRSAFPFAALVLLAALALGGVRGW